MNRTRLSRETHSRAAESGYAPCGIIPADSFQEYLGTWMGGWPDFRSRGNALRGQDRVRLPARGWVGGLGNVARCGMRRV
ncbi:hypothetical protein EDC14_100398 [Hydrogenispora ethanolica]|uniref:Uncharacterized protein n=1 Tax=Hydrogenispora ethanolica TaxID=1082276 RepID=A0A4V2QGB4_HYDET|nr:hypothetical protein [Hydrogenispora ethanolica]TCL75167.1 hypothetical protein EDC14_100398 [Hydrogenispora ethanolica]